MPSAPRRAGADLTRAVMTLVIVLAAPQARADEPVDGGAPAAPVAVSIGAGDAGVSDSSAGQPQEVRVHGTPTSHGSASETATGRSELALRPRLRPEEVLESVPGLFTVQHSGGAKAQQYFLRGFDADHGTDIAFFADGVPLNAVSHAHGQGYTDLHFLIPEVLAAVDATKGPYSARAGDFATAGTVNLRFSDHVDESLIRGEVGPDGRKRALALDSPNLGDRWRALVAAEVFTDDGYFVHPEDHRRFNAYARATRTLDDKSELSLTLMGYGASWNASGIIPARAVCGENDGNAPPEAFGAKCIDRTDSIDPSQGGGSQRAMASVAYRLRLEDVEADVTGYVIRSNLQLFVDDTLFASDPVHGDGIEQDDARTVLGADLHVTQRATLAGMQLRTTVGLQVRNDAIDNALHHQQSRRRLDTEESSNIDESELGAYVEEDFRPARIVRFVLGARVDRADVAVNSNAEAAALQASGVKGSSLLSPKWAAIVSLARGLDFFVDYGRGFHSNDARGVVGGGATLLAPATGYEVGMTLRPLAHLTVSAAAFLLDLNSELVFDGDTGTTNAEGSTRREGIELLARYHFHQALFADAAFTMTRARFRDDTGSGTLVPLAPPVTFAAGAGVREPLGPLTVSGAVRLKSMADRPATQDGLLAAQGFALVDVQAGLRWKNLELAVDLLNVLDQRWREGQFAVTSRLPYESRPVTAMSFTPGWPREILGNLAIYW